MDIAVSPGAASPVDAAAPSAIVGEAAAQVADARGDAAPSVVRPLARGERLFFCRRFDAGLSEELSLELPLLDEVLDELLDVLTCTALAAATRSRFFVASITGFDELVSPVADLVTRLLGGPIRMDVHYTHNRSTHTDAS